MYYMYMQAHRTSTCTCTVKLACLFYIHTSCGVILPAVCPGFGHPYGGLVYSLLPRSPGQLEGSTGPPGLPGWAVSQEGREEGGGRREEGGGRREEGGGRSEEGGGRGEGGRGREG